MRKTNINYRDKKWIFVNTFFVLMLFPLFTLGSELVQKESSESIHTFLKSALPKDAELVHPVVEVALQGASRAVVAIYHDKSQSTNFSGLVLLSEKGFQKNRVTHLEPIKEADGLFEIEVKSVFTVKSNLHNNGLVILYSYYRLGSGEENGNAGYFYYLDGDSWKIDEGLSDRLEGVKNAKQAKIKLK